MERRPRAPGRDRILAVARALRMADFIARERLLHVSGHACRHFALGSCVTCPRVPRMYTWTV